MVDSSPAAPSLAAVRRDLEQIDRAIVVLMAARIDAARTAIRCRSRLDGRIANPAQEARVLARAQAWGEPLGLSPTLTETVFRAIVEEGKARFASEADASVRGSPSSAPGHARVTVPARRSSGSLARAGTSASP